VIFIDTLSLLNFNNQTFQFTFETSFNSIGNPDLTKWYTKMSLVEKNSNKAIEDLVKFSDEIVVVFERGQKTARKLDFSSL